MKRFLPLLLLSATALTAQTPRLTCDNDHGWDKQASSCEVREQKPGSFRKITVDSRTNGGISVRSWANPDILIRSKVQASGDTDAAARALGAQVIVHSAGGAITADGPSTGNWSVSYEIFVPAQTDLNLTAHNGGISISGVNGRLEFQTVNGGIHLAEVAGDVHGRTQNGGVHIELAGARWEGAGLDVQSHNGGVHLAIPANYSAHLETSTVNGHLSGDFPQITQDRHTREARMDLGSGGAPLRVITTNGGVHIEHSSGQRL